MNKYSHLHIATGLSKLLDEQFSFFGIKIGLDPLLGLFPGIGDLISLGLSLYIVFIGILLRVPEKTITAMIRNVLLDFFIGLVPVVGDVADIFYKANRKNLQLLHDHVGSGVVEGEII